MKLFFISFEAVPLLINVDVGNTTAVAAVVVAAACIECLVVAAADGVYFEE